MHSTDSSERYFRIIIEIFLLILFYTILSIRLSYSSLPLRMTISFLIAHTVMFLLVGNFWVYILDSFKLVKNPGINKILSFLNFSKKLLRYFNCCDAILIYGSMCRRQFHDRSDLDLRIVRRTDLWRGLISLPIGIILKSLSFFLILPVDLQVVDSFEFLRRQMRKDEKPIIVYLRHGIRFKNQGISFKELELNPKSVLKK